MNFKKRIRKLRERFGIKEGLPPLHLVTKYVETERDSDGAQNGPLIQSRFAQLDDCAGPVIERGESETLADFKARVFRLMRHPNRYGVLVTNFHTQHPELPPAA